MRSLILSTAARALLPLLLLLSVFLFVRGHNAPGGGFIGGLVASTAYVLYAIAYDVGAARRALRVNPRILMAGGLALALASACFSILAGHDFFQGMWTSVPLPVVGKVGTPLIFDLGVYLAVIGSTLTTLFAAMEAS